MIPVAQTVRNDMAVHPYESATEIITNSKAWAVTDCICRKQQALLGQACEHPLDVCMVFSETEGAFDRMAGMRALTQDEALVTLRRAAEAGLVHSVSNNQQGLWYLCNCCTCACGFLRGLAELGMANVIATSAFLCQVDEDRCIACGECTERCSFGALTVDLTAQIDVIRCAGCGVCVLACPQEALSLFRRPDADVLAPPATENDWRAGDCAWIGSGPGAVNPAALDQAGITFRPCTSGIRQRYNSPGIAGLPAALGIPKQVLAS